MIVLIPFTKKWSILGETTATKAQIWQTGQAEFNQEIQLIRPEWYCTLNAPGWPHFICPKKINLQWIHFKWCYQTSHFFLGFMPEPSGQLKSLAKASLLESGPRILNLPGACGAVSMCSLRAASRYLMHQTWTIDLRLFYKYLWLIYLLLTWP